MFGQHLVLKEWWDMGIFVVTRFGIDSSLNSKIGEGIDKCVT
jgi:hypothetical protein